MNHGKRLPKTRTTPPVYFLLAIILMLGLNYVAPAWQWLPGPYTTIGYLPIAVGLSLGIVGDRQFKRHKTTIKPFEESTAMVTGGVFSFSRNPMYLGMILILAGMGIVMGSLVPLTVVPMFIWWMQTRFIVYEEMMMENTFGDPYRDYKRRVRRWI